MSDTLLYIASADWGLHEWAEHLLHRAGYDTYSPARTEGAPEERFEADMHHLAHHANAVVVLPGWEANVATHGTVLMSRALGLPTWVLVEDHDPKVAFALIDIDAYDEAERDDAIKRHPAGSALAEALANPDPDLGNVEIVGSPSDLVGGLTDESPWPGVVSVLMAALAYEVKKATEA